MDIISNYMIVNYLNYLLKAAASLTVISGQQRQAAEDCGRLRQAAAGCGEFRRLPLLHCSMSIMVGAG